MFTFLFTWKGAGDLKFGNEIEFESNLEGFLNLKKMLSSPCYLMMVSGYFFFYRSFFFSVYKFPAVHLLSNIEFWSSVRIASFFLNDKIDQNTNFVKWPNVAKCQMVAQLLALVIFESVSLVRENMRELRENLGHKIRTLSRNGEGTAES